MRLWLDPRENDSNLYDPGSATIAMATLAMSGISTVGGLVSGANASARNKKMDDQQAMDMDAVRNMANNFVNSIRKEEYDKLANEDVHNAMRDVSDIMSSRGLGLGSSSMASTAAGASAGIRSGYGKQFLQDKQGAQQTAIGAMSGVAQMPRMGYTQDPWADFGAGVQSMGAWAAQNAYGIGVDPVAARQIAINKANGVGASSTAVADPYFGARYGGKP